MVCLTIAQVTSAQVIKLSHSTSQRSILLKEGIRISYSVKGDKGEKVGQLEKITQQSILIDSTIIALEDIRTIGKREKGARFWAFLGATFGGAMIGTAFAPEPDPCPNCQVVIEENRGGTFGDIILVAGGAALVGYSIHSAIKNSPKDIEHGVWKLTVVE